MMRMVFAALMIYRGFFRLFCFVLYHMLLFQCVLPLGLAVAVTAGIPMPGAADCMEIIQNSDCKELLQSMTHNDTAVPVPVSSYPSFGRYVYMYMRRLLV